MQIRLLSLALAILLAAVHVGGVELHLLAGCPDHRHGGGEAHACPAHGACDADARHEGPASTVRVPAGHDSAESAHAVCHFCLALFDASKSFAGGPTPARFDAPRSTGFAAELAGRPDARGSAVHVQPIRGPPFLLHV
jgi:hypothetical protein